ncbi:MAG: hypothetical protein FJ211_05010 [Ignavibacteria bacterium]|nr:hypothetical protein [Ignavibacteria bacterium]
MSIEESCSVALESMCQSRKSRELTSNLKRFATSLDELDLSGKEHDLVMAERFLRAAKLVLERGMVPQAQKFCSRAYTLACKHDISDIAMRAATDRVTLEHILRNAQAIRLWTERRTFHEDRVKREEERQSQVRQLYLREVLCVDESNPKQVFIPYTCDEFRHLLLPYHLCSRGLFHAALNAVKGLAFVHTKSKFLQDELRWLTFRLYASTQQYDQAAAITRLIMESPAITARLQECSTIAAAYCDLMDVLRGPRLDQIRWATRIGMFSNSFHAIVNEPTGLYLSVFVYELVRAIIDQNFILAEQRLAALRVRVHRNEYNGRLFELRSFLKVIGYIQSTHYRYKKVFPTKLYNELINYGLQTKYAQQGIIPYSELAYRILRYLNYT